MIGKILVFRLPGKTEQRIANRFVQKFYGQDTKSWQGRYTFHKTGFMESIPHRKIMGGVIVIGSKDLEEVLKFLRQYSADIYARDIILETDDRKYLKSPDL